jgi:branched-subunit amino acid transport protein AzlD
MDSYIWGVILVGTLATFATRALPFVLLGRFAQHPLLRYLGRYLPPVLMVLLVVYATADLISSSVTLGVVLVSSLCVALLQWTLKNPLISIFAGSLVYALLI